MGMIKIQSTIQIMQHDAIKTIVKTWSGDRGSGSGMNTGSEILQYTLIRKGIILTILCTR